MKKKVLIVTPDLSLGGIRTAFINLLHCVEKSPLYDIDVMVFSAKDYEEIPSGIKIIKSNRIVELLNFSQNYISSKSKFLGVVRYALGGITRAFGSSHAYKLVFSTYKKLKGYDYAISFAQSGRTKSLYGGTNEFVLSHVEATQKITFLHCDYEKCGINDSYSESVYQKFDKIAAVSEGVKNSFIKCLPDMSERVYVVHNFHCFDKIIDMSKKDTVEYKKDTTNFITVARLSKEKGHYRALKIFERLKKEGFDFCWHIIGGADKKIEDEFRDNVKKCGLTENVIMYSNQDNPYRFFPNADVFLLPSYHEAAPMVFSEAEVLCVPIITTNTLSAKEFVADKNIGIVCENDEDIYRAMRVVMEGPDVLLEMKETLIKNKPDNKVALKEFIELLE